ncbi:hypothetical protein DFH07DRAFT_912046 [Mycena maculata]|uniref:Uncharacterized protein n=1 Tax=Mycena maculata TaxID=230809 RepID=A0AAD7K3F7_9AGAR|nr:hypothetical protein DFH07DRAFT_912046 [Mycena maculata]
MAKSTAKYTLLPTADEEEALLASPSRSDSDADADDSDDEPLPGEPPADASSSFPPAVDPRFVQPTPAPWKRAGLLLVIVLLFWAAFQFKGGYRGKPKVVHASRYSKEFKYRPAASPIITETLKDGRLRVRGAAPTTSATPAPIPTTTKPKLKQKRSGKGKAKGKKGKKAA